MGEVGAIGRSRRALGSSQRYVWDDPDKLKEEERFLLKLDNFLLRRLARSTPPRKKLSDNANAWWPMDRSRSALIPWDRKKFFGIAKQWQFWVLSLGYRLVQRSFPVYQPVVALWLKSKGHSVHERNVWSPTQVVVGVVVQLLAEALSNSPFPKGRR